MPDIFLSYNREDLPSARRFAEGFERAGFDVWWDATLNPGEAYDQVTEKALAEAGAVVVLWSRKSVESRWVRAEATQASSNGTLLPVMIEPCKRPIMFELTHTIDLSHWKGDPQDGAWQALLAGVRRFVRKELPAPAAVSRASTAKRRINAQRIATVAAGLLLAGIAFWAFSRRSAEPSGDAVKPAVTLAVLPFADMSPAHDQEYFSDGLTEELLNQLAQIKDMRVTARTSSFAFKGRNEDVRVIGEKLGVANLLEGSVRKDGNQLRITAQLISSRDGAHLWSRTYNRELKDVFAIQEEISQDVAKALSVKLDVGDSSRARGGTTSLEAYDRYLQAGAILNQGYLSERILQVDQLLREAVMLDPLFVRAWSELARSLRATAIWKADARAALREEAAAAGARVRALAPDSVHARYERWNELMEQHRWSEAEPAARAAAAADREIEEFPIAGFLLTTGRLNQALSYVERRRQRDPLSLSASIVLQIYLDATGRSSEAAAEYERSRSLAGDHGEPEGFALIRYLARKDSDRAAVKARFRASLEHAPLAIDASLADQLEDKEAARTLLHQAFEDPANQQSLRMVLIAFYAGLFDDRDLVLAAVRRATIDLGGDVSVVWLAYGIGVRSDPRFKDLLRELKLVDYFRSSGNWGDFCGPAGPDDFECH